MKTRKLFLIIVSAIVIFGVIARIMPHDANFAPMGAIALFAVAFYKKKSLALIIPVSAWWLSDLYLNNVVYPSNEGFTWFTYDQLFSILALIAIVGLGSLLLKKLSIASVMISSLSASLIFFVISNFGVWIKGFMYPKTWSGLITCYEMGLPFYKATFVSDLVYTGVFFTAMYFLNKTSIAKTELSASTN
jgi:hypothetical protein